MSPIRVILHPTDFSDDSAEAARIALAVARDRGARLVVLHVAPREIADGRFIVGPTPHAFREQLWDHLRRFEVAEPRVHIEPILKEGTPAAEILRTAQESHCDLIVMGTHGRSGLGCVLMGSVAESVLRSAECPVLVVKGHRRETSADELDRDSVEVEATPVL
jgi:nucleotide-binding universal stress UspA family protein